MVAEAAGPGDVGPAWHGGAMTVLSTLAVAAVCLLAGGLAGWSTAVSRLGSSLRSAQVRVAQAEARLDAGRAAAADRVQALQADQTRLSDQFRVLAADALASNNEQFLALAHQRLAASQQSQVAELGRSEAAVRQLVEPLTRTLDQVKTELTSAQAARLTGQAALGEQVRAMRESSELLRTETAQLVTALRSSQVRGRWGELQLRRVVESAGMLAHVDFVEQASTRTDDGLLRPDMVVRLSGGKNVVIDAKVAFLGYLDAAQATDDTVRADRLAAHARHVRKHIDDLAAKRYWDQFTPAPEFVVMFVPAEAFFHAAIEQDATIVEYAFERNVIIATPMTLLALLRTVAYAWRQDALAANAQQVLDLGKELHGRLATLGTHVARLGRALDSAASAYNQTVSSLETRVLVSARRFADLKVVDGDLPTPPTSDPQLSAVSAPELVASIDQQVVAIDVATAGRLATGT